MFPLCSCHAGDDLDSAMSEDHEAHTQASVCPVPHAGPWLYLLLIGEVTSERMGPEAA